MSEAFAQSLKDALDKTEYADRFSELWLDPIEDWALGARYRAWCGSGDDHIAMTVYELKDAVESVYDVSDGSKVLLYQDENDAPEDVEQPDNGGIRIVDGVLGEYGKNVTIPSEILGEYTYAWYTVPYGTYEVQNELKTATIFVVDDTDSGNVSDVIRFSEKGESQRVTINEGYHIELSEGTEILLLPLE